MIRLAAPDIFEKDAVGNFCLDLAACLRKAGEAVALYANAYTREQNHGIRPMQALFDDIATNDSLILSYSILDPNLERVLALPNHKFCYFHGVTPPDLLEQHESETAALCRASISQFPLLAHFDRVVANSDFTANGLKSYGVTNALTALPVFPTRPVLTAHPIDNSPSPTGRLLSVGRIVPHKKLDDAIDLLAALRAIMPDASLTIVGGGHNTAYRADLDARIARHGLGQAIQFTGMVDDDALIGHYRAADALVSLSAHEGFCVPVLEAMHLGLPAFVRRGTAAEEVAHNLDCLLPRDASMAAMAAHIADVLNTPARRAGICMAGLARSKALLEQDQAIFWLDLIRDASAPTPSSPRNNRL